MNQLIVLKIGEGSFEQGFPVTLQLGEESDAASGDRLAYHPLAEVIGRLPADPLLPLLYRRWQSAYLLLGVRSRLDAPKAQITNVSVIEDCQQAAQELAAQLNRWLRHELFRPIREKWLEQVQLDDTVRVILQTDHALLQRLPWHLWEIIERYANAEVALSLPIYERVTRSTPANSRIKILAILGNSQGIDVQADRALLERLPNAEVCFLAEPQRQTLTDRLWSQSWDILFFAGHSSSRSWEDQERGREGEGENWLSTFPSASETGYLSINRHESLSIAQLRYALKQAVARGLKLAIFNSCDGLGLARNLADLQIPQMIVMREPVPDRVAQAFLKSFLEAFAQGQPFYRAVRQARERLQGLEAQFPCATWLPVICQNPAEVPPSWHRWLGLEAAEVAADRLHSAPPGRVAPGLRRLGHWGKQWRGLSRGLICAGVATLAIVGLRHSGALQSWELNAYDQMLRLRPAEYPDPRIWVVTIDEQERRTYGDTILLADGAAAISLSDRSLDRLLTVLERYQPSVIGLDLYRDFPVQPGQAALAAQLRRNPKIVAVCLARFQGGDSIASPPDVPADRVGFSDFVRDGDDVLRRHLLAMTPDLIDPSAPCTAPDAFSVAVADRYLSRVGIDRRAVANQLQWGDVEFANLERHWGGYHDPTIDTSGNQVLLNYRAAYPPSYQSTLTQVFSGEINPVAVKDRIVLIGAIAESAGDFWSTPVHPRMPGVQVQAHMVSQILSAVLDQRPLLRPLSPGFDLLWIGSWSMVGSLLAGWRLPLLRLGLAIAALIGGLQGICFAILLRGIWLPAAPAVLGLLLTSAIGLCWRVYRSRSSNPGHPRSLNPNRQR